MSPDHQAWFRKADEDLLIIDNNLVASKVPWPQMCYHAQQLAEKYLKGFLVRHGVLPPKTHDLERLLALAVRHDESLAIFHEDCARLTALGSRSRYPDTAGDSNESDGRYAIGVGRRIRDAVRARVPEGETP